MRLDLDFVRARFPALRSPWALFDNAGGSVTAQPVIDRITDYLTRHQVQLGASYGLSREAEAAVRAGEAAAAALLGADVEETIVGPSTTVNLETMARALEPLCEPLDEIVVTNLDHEANIGCWRRMSARRGLRLRTWGLRPETGRLELEDLQALLGPKTRMVCFTHCANVVGELVDVPRIVRAIRDNRADTWVCVDGVAYAPHRQMDPKAWDVDLYAASLYKVYGPHLGVLYGRKSLLLAAKGQNHDFVPEDRLPYKFQPGNVTHELAAGLVGITDYLEEVADHHGIDAPSVRARHAAVFETFARHEADLTARLLTGLKERSDIRILGPVDADPSVRVPTVAFTVEGQRSSQIPERIDGHRVAVRFGHFYAKRAIDALSLAEHDGVVRVSMVHYNTAGEVDRFLAALDDAIG